MVIMSIATRVNGVAPPEVPVSDIDLGSWEFWLQDDDVRGGAFATLRREAPISFWASRRRPGLMRVPATGR
jgi:methyl-branched lipid omega-hydroxylase